jgi:hypothetical protein
MKHTHGPWTDSTIDPYTFAINAPGGDSDLGYRSWAELATVYGSKDDGIPGHRKGEANARLIAAAPELLEALASFVFVLDHGNGPDLRKAYERGKAAIAKAEGEV